MTKGAIFILTSVITAGMMQGVSAGSRMLFRNAFKNVAKKALAKSSELTAKTIGTKAVVSIGYQTITQDGKVNLVTVLGDSFFSPFVGAALGNIFTLNINLINLKIEYKSLFSRNTASKEYVAAVLKTIIMGTAAKYCPIGFHNNNGSVVVGNLIYSSNTNAFSEGVGKIIMNENE